MQVSVLALLLASALAARAQPGGGGPGGGGPGGGGGGASTPGSVSSTACGSVTTCPGNTSSYVSRALTYAPSTGLFTGSLTTNGCPSTVTTFAQAGATCVQQTFPGTTYTLPSAAPLTGIVGYSLSGMNIYNALENGFSSGNGPTVCSTSGYFCSAGGDLGTCIGELYYTCGASAASSVAAAVAGTTFGDKCQGHASPYHFHVDLACEYAPNAAASSASVTTHSPLVGLALDGRGIYGAWESAGALPSLDACNGHVGPTPGTASATSSGVLSSTVSGITGLAASTSVYHYHLSSTFPFTLGCYANTFTSNAACRALYPTTCNTYVAVHYANGSAYFYDDWCPCGNPGAAAGTVAAAVAINTLPSTSGATCATFGSGSKTSSGYSTCSLTQLGVTSGGSGSVMTPILAAVPSSPPPSMTSGAIIVRATVMAAVLASALAALALDL